MKGTHDLSFMISPWARLTWELNGDRKAYQSLITAAQNLSTRFDPKIGCLRSWDTCVTKRYSFTDPERDFLVIIVSISSSFQVVFRQWLIISSGQHAKPRPPLLGRH